MSLYAAASEAVRGFESLPRDVSKTFIFVGNKQSHGFIYPPLVSLGMGKAAAAYLIGSCAVEYSKKGFKYAFIPGRRIWLIIYNAASTMLTSERTMVKQYSEPLMARLTENTCLSSRQAERKDRGRRPSSRARDMWSSRNLESCESMSKIVSQAPNMYS